jgi:hypothetical protein
MIAIQTKFLPVTNSRGSRIKAWTSTGFSVTISYPHEESFELSHFKAVEALVTKYQLDWDLSGMRWGGTKTGYVFCFADSIVKTAPKKPEYQPKTGAKCGCRPGQQRDNCPRCEGTGEVIDFAAIRARS